MTKQYHGKRRTVLILGMPVLLEVITEKSLGRKKLTEFFKDDGRQWSAPDIDIKIIYGNLTDLHYFMVVVNEMWRRKQMILEEN